MRPLIITSIEHRPMDGNDLASVRIKWEKVYVDDKRTLIGYQIFYKESWVLSVFLRAYLATVNVNMSPKAADIRWNP